MNLMDVNKIPINIYSDLSKAFDNLGHIILVKLERLVVKLMVYFGLFRSYLSDHEQYDGYNSTKSKRI